jgi:hypothetical protein
MGESDDDEKLQYLKGDLLRSHTHGPWRSTGDDDDDDDDDSNQMFMSEPSTSEAGSGSHDDHFRLLSPGGSYSDDDDDDGPYFAAHPPPPPPPPPPQTTTNPTTGGNNSNNNSYSNNNNHAARLYHERQAAMSPGNTSLSSWESPHIARRVELHFGTPDRKAAGDDSHSVDGASSMTSAASASNNMKRHQQLLGIKMEQSQGTTLKRRDGIPNSSNSSNSNNNNNNHMDLIPPRASTSTPGFATNPGMAAAAAAMSSGASTSSASEGQPRRMELFLDDLRASSQGQLFLPAGGESDDANTSFESSLYQGQPENMNGILRPTHHRLSSMDTALVQNRSADSALLMGVFTQDDTVVMTLSASDDEGSNKKDSVGFDNSASRCNYSESDTERTFDRPQNSADDEKTTDDRRPNRSARIRSKQGGSSSGGGGQTGGSTSLHRRQRSGDSAAASLLTGSTDWKGMEQDNLPLPGQLDDEDDDESKMSADHPHNNLFESNNKKLSAASREASQSGKKIEGASFAIGTTSGCSASYQTRQSRRARRDSRTRPTRGSFTESFDTADYPATYSSPLQGGGDLLARSLPNVTRMPLLSTAQQPRLDPFHTTGTRQQLLPQYGSYHMPPPLHVGGTAPPPLLPGKSPRSQFIANVQDHWSYTGSERVVSRKQPFPSPAETSYAEENPTQGAPQDRWGHTSWNSADSPFSWLSGMHHMNSEASPRWTANHNQELFQNQRQQEDAQSGSECTASSEEDRNIFLLRDPARPNATRVVRHSFQENNPFANIGKAFQKADRRQYLPLEGGETSYPTYICPCCKTRQREFFTVSNAPLVYESASGYVAVYFAIYVVAALCIFGLQVSY